MAPKPPTEDFERGQAKPAGPTIEIPKGFGRGIPPGLAFLRVYITPLRNAPVRFYQFYMLGITYFLYVFYHISRKPFSITKNQLHQNCSLLNNTPTTWDNVTGANKDTWCSWAPFEKPDYKLLFGGLDAVYYTAYAIAMMYAGTVADRFNLRYFLLISMVSAGTLTIFFGMAKPLQIHHIAFFYIVQIIGGALQACFYATGFPAVVALVGNWFAKKGRGTVFGFWNSHASLGNILGSLLAAVWVEKDWTISFVVCGLMIVAGGVISWLFVVIQPEDAGFPAQNVPEGTVAPVAGAPPVATVEEPHLPFLKIVMIPGVIEYSVCMFFAKGVAYCFINWLPVYIKQTMGTGSMHAGNTSIFYDMGGMLGGILVGIISDYFGAKGMISGTLMFAAVPVMGMLKAFGHLGFPELKTLLFFVGMITVGPYSIISTAVATDLGSSLKGQAKAVATVSAIINGFGSFGTVFGPLVVSWLAGIGGDKFGWNIVIYFLIGSQAVAAACLGRLMLREYRRWNVARLVGTVETVGTAQVMK
ncbi:Glucose-6-phosphate [Hypsibius exemplaris]|uniref:Glucose-6-phosphate n=1 Tax=Hypsibius exemplaris TaxID=2072580 RepID=A0A1W0WXD3_HYPEX|nr:Glucose-6-phosphate [Hypsibius exemplaris]